MASDWHLSEEEVLDEMKIYFKGLYGLGSAHLKFTFYEVYEVDNKKGKKVDSEMIGWLELYYNHHTGTDVLFAYNEWDTGSDEKHANMHITYENHHIINKIAKIVPKGINFKVVSIHDKVVKW